MIIDNFLIFVIIIPFILCIIGIASLIIVGHRQEKRIYSTTYTDTNND
jgi:hypothetical protein